MPTRVDVRRATVAVLAVVVVVSVVAVTVQVSGGSAGTATPTATPAATGIGLESTEPLRSPGGSVAGATSTETSDPKYGNNSTTREVTVDDGAFVGASTEPTIDLQYTLNRTPSNPGSVVWTMELTPYDGLKNYTVTLESNHQVLSTTGFIDVGGGSYKWNDSAGANPRITVQADANKTDSFGTDSVDTGPWAFIGQDVYTEQFYYYYYFGEQPTIRRTFTTVRSGYVTDSIGYAYLGSYDLRNRSDYVNTRFVDPDSTVLDADPQRVGRLLSNEGEQLDIGARDRTVTIFTPGDPMRGGGAAYDDEFWVKNSSSITPDYGGSVYYHEYVHTRQAFANSSGVVGENTYWLVEGSAEYYQHYVPYRFGQISDTKLRSNVVAESGDRDAVLTTIGIGDSTDADYEKGGHVLTALDLKIRNVSGGSATLEDVLREVNERELQNGDSAVTFAEFKNIVEQEAGTSLDNWLERYVDSTDIPPLPQDLSAAYDTTGGVPTAEAGPNLTVREGETVTLEARHSTDPNLEPLSYAWTQTDGPSATIADPKTATPDVTAPRVRSDSTLTLRLQADDDDGNGDTDTLTVTVLNVSAENKAPRARDDSNTTAEDTTLSVSAPGVLGNDSDPDGDTLTASLAAGPANGTVSLAANGSYEYTPNPNFAGTDSFTYEARDGAGGTDTATVTVTVTAVNDDPVVRNDSYSTNEDTTLSVSAPGVLANDTDVDDDTLATDILSGAGNGTVGLAPNGSFTYEPAPNFTGTDSFRYIVTDGDGGSDTATVTIEVSAVNDDPVARDDTNTTAEDTTLSVPAPGVLGNDTDVDGDTLSAAVATSPDDGTLSLDPDGSYEYTPDPNFTGTDSFTYEARDGAGGTDTATVTVTVTPVNDPPVARDDAYSTNEDTTLSVSAPGVLDNDTDVDGDALTAALVSGPTNGTLTLHANGSFTYRPDTEYSGTDSFTYEARDGNGGTDTATVTIEVAAVNDRPVARDDTNSTAEDTTLSVSAPGVLGNDSDPDGDTLTATLISGPANGTVSLAANGSYEYTPDPDFAGTDSFTYEARDGAGGTDTATVTIEVKAVDDLPVARDDAYSTNEDTTLSVPGPGVLGNDSDPDDTLSASLSSGPANGTLTLNANGSFTYEPDANVSGTDSFVYNASDGTTVDSATVTITVAAVNDDPVARDETNSTPEDTTLSVPAPGVLANDTDVDGDTLTAALVSGPTNGTVTLNESGVYEYTPDANFTGTDSFTYETRDGDGGTDTAAVTITVTPVNDDPVAQNDSYSTDEDTALSVSAPGVLGNDTDVDGDALTAALVSGPTDGTVTVSANGSYVYTPDPGFSGTDSFTYEARDGAGGTDTASVTVEVRPAAEPLTLDWQSTVDARVQGSSPAVGPDRVYVGSLGRELVAFDRSTGTGVWTFERSGSLVDSSPVLADDTVYVGSGGGTLYALWATNGSVRWQFDNDSAISSTPRVSGDTLYVGSNDGTVYALDVSTGALRWATDVGAPVLSRPAVHGAGGRVYVTSEDGTLTALDTSDGAVAWNRSTGANDLGGASPVVVDGDVVVASDRVYRYDASGTRLWAVAYGGTAGSSPTVAGDTVYVGSATGSLSALNVADGTARWRAELGATVAADPTTVDGRVLVSTTAGRVYLLNASTGGLVATADLGAAVRSPATVAGDTAYVGTRDGIVVGLGNVSAGTAGATPSLVASVDVTSSDPDHRDGHAGLPSLGRTGRAG